MRTPITLSYSNAFERAAKGAPKRVPDLITSARSLVPMIADPLAPATTTWGCSPGRSISIRAACTFWLRRITSSRIVGRSGP